MDDLTCPSLLIEEDSDYGSRDTSDNDDFVIGGFCTIFSHLDGKGGNKIGLNKERSRFAKLRSSLAELSLVLTFYLNAELLNFKFTYPVLLDLIESI